MIGPIIEVAGKVAEVAAAEVSKETAKEVGNSAVKKGVDVSKRVEIGKHPAENLKSGIDVSKRINPDNKGGILDTFKDITIKQKNELSKNGMSSSLIEDCKYKDGVYRIKTRNENFADSIHPDSGVQYVRKVVDLFGNKIEGVFPKFKSEFTTYLPDNLLTASDYKQFSYCTAQLQDAIKTNPELKAKFTPRQLKQIEQGKVPGGYVWHHNEEKGKMELVDAKTHDAAKHTGGRALWGGGSSMR